MPPAARVTDMHICPMVTGIVPHVGGPILPPCSPNVLIGFLPAARVTDQAVCVGPPDIIVKGSPTVMINNLLAARVTDTTAHGGMIILGCFTVIIGEAGMGVPPSAGFAAPAASGPPTAPPTASELQGNPVVRQALNQAWADSNPGEPAKRHEEGGWIFMNTTTGEISVTRAPSGAQASLNLSRPPEVSGSVVVAKFHTHPNPTSEGWDPGPSPADARVDALHGVPDLIRADDGDHVSGPDSRRGGLGGGAGFPP